MKYPNTRTVEQVDNYHGTLVSDPYRWLEDTDSPETRAWVEAQNRLTYAHLEQIAARGPIRKTLTELWNYARQAAPFKKGGRYFQQRNTGLQNQDVLYTFENFTAEPRILLDPNTLSEDGTVALTAWTVSKDGRLLAYAVSASGSDWVTWRVRDVQTGADLPDLIQWSKFSGAAWLPDSTGFYYSRYDQPQEGQAYEGINQGQRLYFHRVGSPQSEDVLVYERPDQPGWGFSPTVTDDGRYLIIHVWQGTDTRNLVFYQDLSSSGGFVELIAELEASYGYVDNDGPIFTFRTDQAAPRGRLIAVDIRHPEREGWKTVIPEGDDVLESVQVVNHQFVTLYLHHAHYQIVLFAKDGTRAGEVRLPTLGTVTAGLNPGVSGNKEDTEMFYTFSSFAHPAAVYRYDFGQGKSECIFFPAIPFEFEAFETEQMFVASKDGTKIPMFLIHRKDLQRNGQNPTLLYGYGGFNISYTPIFAVQWLGWLSMGGVLAIGNLRGGGEYGEDWHKAGMIHNKQNVFDDFIACAEYLIAAKITSTPKLAVHGRSNGGLLIGAMLTQRPDLFGAALPAVGVMDMLRFHRFTIGWAWVSDYGCADDPEQFQTLYAYSPLHNLKAGTCYPPTLITTGDHDDRVVPGHSFKFGAAIQAAQGCDQPVLIRIQTKAGHGFGKPTAVLIEEWTDQFAFLADALDM